MPAASASEITLSSPTFTASGAYTVLIELTSAVRSVWYDDPRSALQGS